MEQVSRRSRRLEWWVPGIYAVIAGAWIYFSDNLVAAIAGSIERQHAISSYKGFGFVVVTAAMLHAGLRWALRRERASAQRVRESEALLRAITSAIPDPVFLKGRDGRWIFANPATLKVIGKTMAEVIGKTDVEIYRDLELGAVLMETDRRIMESGVEEVVEENILGPQGYRTFLSSKAPYLDAEGRVIGLIGNARDITERKLAEDERHRLELQLQQVQKMESLGSLAGGVAHDMNNVLGAILGLASANIEIQPADSAAHRAFGTIIQAAERGGKMVKSLLNFARQSPVDMRELDLNLVLQEEVRLLERTTLSRVKLEMDLAADLRPIRGDASALTHAFINVCVNAVDAMSGAGTLLLQTRNVDSDWVEVVVEDTGTGMSKDVLEKAMDPFFTTKEQGKGTGLGLSLVFNTVKAHQGLLWLESELGKGTRVRMRFPACEAGEELAATPTTSVQAAASGGLKVLLVDDDELIQFAVQAQLEVLGHQGTVVANGEEALVALEAGFNPDVVILDMNMPGLGGVGTLPKLRALRPTLPVLLSTGRADQIAQNLAATIPHVTLLSKPFTMDVLKNHLETLGQG
ncbi:MAG: PAS domain-containing protein [Holophaga sp.]|nr:PAS domain-containing protein [Holophaga sp.]